MVTVVAWIRRVWLAGLLAGGFGLFVSASASAAGPNLIVNGDFESGTTNGWTALSSTLSVVSPGFAGSFAGKATNTSAADYGLRAAVRPVQNGVAGTQYAGSGMVRSDTPGKKVCIYLTEYAPNGSQLGQSKTCTTTQSGWIALAPVSRTLIGSGGTMAFAVRQGTAVAGDSFEVDNLSLVQDTTGAPTTVALWHMDETTGPMVDSGASPANNGTLNGTISRGAAGVAGTAYSFTHGWVSVPTETSLNPGSANITIQASLNPTSLPTSGDFDIIRKGDSPAQLYKVEVLQSGALFCQFAGATKTAAATSTNTITPNTGYHTIRCIKTGSQIQAVVDGVTTTTSAQVGSITNHANVVLGAHTGGNNDLYKGALDEVSIAFG